MPAPSAPSVGAMDNYGNQLCHNSGHFYRSWDVIEASRLERHHQWLSKCI
jgi:hypothetical protein